MSVPAPILGYNQPPLDLFDSQDVGHRAPSQQPASLLTPSTGRKSVLQDAEGFEDWYSGYPRKRCKADAANAYRAALRKGLTHVQLIGARDVLVAERREAEYWPYPATFLRRHLEDYLRDEHADPVEAHAGPVCPEHGPGPCWFALGSGWMHP